MALGIDEYLKGCTGKFVWGKRDCWTFVSGWLRERGHVAVCDWIDFRLGSYGSAREYARTALREGLRVTPSNVPAQLPVEFSKLRPKPGDLAIIHTCGEWALALIDGDGNVAVRMPEGLVRVPISAAVVYCYTVAEFPK